MAIQLSSTMATNLLALNSITDDLNTTQTRLNTGKAINSATDNPALYAKAQSYTDRADKLTSVNQSINTALKNVTTAGNALDSIYKNFDGLLSTLRDAKTKAVTAATAVNVSGKDLAVTAGTSTVAKIAGNIVGTTAADKDASDRFMAGDTFAITIQVGVNQSVTRFFTAVAPTTTLTPTVNNTGKTGELGASAAATNANAFQFSDASSLAAAINTAFGNTNIVASYAETTTTGATPVTTGKLSLLGRTADTQISMVQANDVLAPGSTTDRGATVDFSKLFGASTDGDLGKNVSFGNNQTAVANASSSIYGSTSGTGSNAASLETRKLAADAFNRALYSADNTIKDAYLPGFANLLQGATMQIEMNETVGDSTQYVSVGSSLSMTSLGFAGYKATVAGGALTLVSDVTKINFSKDDDLDKAISQVTTAMTTLRLRQNSLDQVTSNIQARLDFNKKATDLLSTSATEITASDAKQDAANLAAIQNRQAFAMNNLAITKQNEQGLIQLLR